MQISAAAFPATGAILMRSSVEGVQTNMQDGSRYLILA